MPICITSIAEVYMERRSVANWTNPTRKELFGNWGPFICEGFVPCLNLNRRSGSGLSLG